LPRLGLPEWTVTFVIVLLLLGFPVALFMAWAFELTPEGMKRTADVPDGAGATRDGRHGLDWLIIAALVVVIGMMASERWFLADRVAAGPVPVAATDGSDSTRSGSSIAVLAFDNMSPDPDNAYFAEGISEEILNILAGVEGLHVASRSSAFSFRGKNTPIPEVARELNVKHVLEGSVRKQGNRVRITAQLIRADTDGHLWSQAFDRDLVDIFQVQEEIAQAITLALAEVLGVRDVSVQAPTSNLEAYERFLRGRAQFHQRSDFDRAIADLRYAVEQDPGFGEAWIYLAAANLVAPGYDVEKYDHTAMMRETRGALERARALMPEHPMIFALQGMILSNERKPEALELLRQASEMRSHDSTPTMWFGLMLYAAGYSEEAAQVLEQASAMDPMVGINQGYLGMSYLALGREAEAESRFRRAHQLGWAPGLWVHAIELAARGEPDAAGALLQEVLASDGPYATDVAALIMALRDPAQADAIILEKDYSSFSRPPEEWLALGQPDRYLDALHTRAMTGLLQNQPGWLRAAWLPSSGPVREDPRFFVVADSLGMVTLWESRGYPAGCERVTSAAGDRLECGGVGR
jgi:TolB-like protein